MEPQGIEKRRYYSRKRVRQVKQGSMGCHLHYGSSSSCTFISSISLFSLLVSFFQVQHILGEYRLGLQPDESGADFKFAEILQRYCVSSIAYNETLLIYKSAERYSIIVEALNKDVPQFKDRFLEEFFRIASYVKLILSSTLLQVSNQIILVVVRPMAIKTSPRFFLLQLSLVIGMHFVLAFLDIFCYEYCCHRLSHIPSPQFSHSNCLLV